jgi:hypothetical protein
LNGFSLYETFRILIPGGVAASILVIVLRLATLDGQPTALATAAETVTTGAVFLLMSLTLGFLLYALDLPNKTRLAAEGDPDNHVYLPSTVLFEMLKGTPAAGKSFSLYFFLTDAYLPAETHRRIYFFGGIHRIFADARFLLASSVILGPQICLALIVPSSILALDFSGVAAWTLGLAFTVLAGVAVLAELPHALASISKAKREPTAGRARYRTRLLKGIGHIWRAWMLLLALGIGSVILTNAGSHVSSVFGVGLSLAALLLWGMLEVGPPRDANPRKADFRSACMRTIGLKPWTRTQYIPAQRAMFDLAAFLPPLVATSAITDAQQVPAMWILAWAALASLATVVMAIRKHEVRLINNYKDQVTWLRLNESKIKRLGRAGEFDGWS